MSENPNDIGPKIIPLKSKEGGVLRNQEVIKLKSSREGIMNRTGESLTEKNHEKEAIDLIKKIFSPHSQREVSNAIGADNYELFLKLLAARLKIKSKYQGCEINGNDSYINWQNANGQIVKESLKNYFKLDPAKLMPLFSKEVLRRDILEKNMAMLGLETHDINVFNQRGLSLVEMEKLVAGIQTMGLDKEDMKGFLVSNFRLKEVEKYVSEFRKIGVTRKFTQFLHHFGFRRLAESTSSIKGIRDLGITDEDKILKFIDKNGGWKYSILNALSTITSLLSSLDKMGVSKDIAKQFFNNSENLREDLDKYVRAEEVRYLKNLGITVDWLGEYWPKVNLDLVINIDLVAKTIEKAKELGLNINDTFKTLCENAHTLRSRLSGLEQGVKANLSLEERQALFKSPKGYNTKLELLLKAGIKTNLEKLCKLCDNDGDFYTVGNLKTKFPALSDNDVLKLFESHQWRALKTMEILKEKGGENWTLTELVAMATMEKTEFYIKDENVEKLPIYFNKLRTEAHFSMGLIEQVYAINKDPEAVVKFVKRARSLVEGVKNEDIVETLKYTNDPEYALKLLGFKDKSFATFPGVNSKESDIGKIAKLLAARDFPFTPQEGNFAVDHFEIDSIKILGKNLEAFRYLDVFNPNRGAPFNDDHVKYVAKLIELQVPKEDLSKVWQFSANPEEAVQIAEWDRRYGFEVRSKTEEQGRKLNAAQALSYFMKKNPGPELIKLMVFVFKKTTEIRDGNIDSFLKEPALPLCEKTMKLTNDPALALKIGRNLYLEGFPLTGEITPDLFATKVAELKELQEKLASINIWEGANVVIAANNETWPNGSIRFMRPEVESAIKKSVGLRDKVPKGNVETVRANPQSTSQELIDKKNHIINAIRNTPPPFRFVFDGHGVERELVLHNGSGIVISTKDLGEAIAARKQKFAEKDLARDLYILSSCFSHNFQRDTMLEIQKNNGTMPIFIGEPEMGQFGFTSDTPETDMMTTVLGAGKRNVNLKYAMEHERDYGLADLSIYIPGKKSFPQQVVKNMHRGQKSAIG